MARHSAQVSLKVMLHGTIRNDIAVSNSYNTVPALQRCVALKIVVTNRPVYNHLYSGSKRFDSLTVVYLLNTPCPNKQDSSITGDDLEKRQNILSCASQNGVLPSKLAPSQGLNNGQHKYDLTQNN